MVWFRCQRIRQCGYIKIHGFLNIKLTIGSKFSSHFWSHLNGYIRVLKQYTSLNRYHFRLWNSGEEVDHFLQSSSLYGCFSLHISCFGYDIIKILSNTFSSVNEDAAAEVSADFVPIKLAFIRFMKGNVSKSSLDD